MSLIKNLPNEPDPRLQQMLAAYGNTPERDLEAARRTEARFRAELDELFPEPLAIKPAVGLWVPSILRTLNDNLTQSFKRRPAILLGLSLMVLWACFFGGVGTTAYAAGSSLPGDRLYSVKTVMESVRADLTLDSAQQARLYMDFAGRRLVEMQALMREDRFADMDQAAREYEIDLQKSLRAIETGAQREPDKAAVLRQEMLATLQDHGRTLVGLLAGAPIEARSGIQNAIHVSATVSAALDSPRGDDNDDDDGNLGGRPDDDDCLTPSPGSRNDHNCETPQSEAGGTATETPQPPATPSNNNSNNNSGGNNSGGDDDAGNDDDGGDEDDDDDDDGDDDDDN
jgi:hypothetical protein